MAFEDKKGIVVASPFKLQAEALLDVRQQVDTIAERDRLVTLKAATAGLRVFVKENSTSYVYTGSKWDPLATGAPYKHPTGDGNHHVPATGTTNAGKYLKAGVTAGSEAWSKIAASDITGLPTRLPNPYALKFTGAATATYDGSGAVTVNIPTSLPTGSTLTVKLNGGNAEGTNKFTFNGSEAKEINITPAAIGAATSGHTHTPASIGAAPTSHNHTISQITDIANAYVNRAKQADAIRDSNDGHLIQISYQDPELSTASWFPAYKGNNKIGTIGTTNLRKAISAAPLVHTHEDTDITWGTKSAVVGGVSPVDAALSNVHSANRFAFANPLGITVEYSRDNGNSWQAYTTNDNQKTSLVSGLGATYSIGAAFTGITTQYKLRITLDANKMRVYTSLKKLLLNISTNGATGCKCLVEKAQRGSETSFTTVGTYNIEGWSSWNSIPIKGAFGGGVSQTSNLGAIRLTLYITSTSSSPSNLSLLDIYAVGDTYWTTPSTMARTGHMYEYDSLKNVTFPGNVTAKTFVGNLSGTATALSTNAGAANRPVYFSGGKPVACTHTLDKSVPSNAVFTDTVYTHPGSHPATMITQDASHRFVTDAEKTTWNGKAPASHTHTASQVTGLPTKLPNPQPLKFTGAATATYDGSGAVTVNIPTAQASPHALTVQLNGGTSEGTNKFTFNGGTAKTINITPAVIGAATAGHTHTPASIGAAAASHTHTASQVTGLPTSLKNPYALTIKTNGTSAAVYDGSAVKEVNITAASVGAAASSHGHGAFKAATASAAGGTGFVPAPAAGKHTAFLRGDGTWQPISLTLAALGVTATATELNYMKGVTSAVQTQLNGKAAASHTHTPASIGAAPASHTHSEYLPKSHENKFATNADGQYGHVRISNTLTSGPVISQPLFTFVPTLQLLNEVNDSLDSDIKKIIDGTTPVGKSKQLMDSVNNQSIGLTYDEISKTGPFDRYKFAMFYNNSVIGGMTPNRVTDFIGAAKASHTHDPYSIGAAPSSHTHNYAGSSSAGGPANSAKKVDFPVGTVLWTTSSSATFFSSTCGGTWEVLGNIDTIINSSTTLTLYMHKKKAL